MASGDEREGPGSPGPGESWTDYSWSLVKKTGHGTYNVAHYLGEKLADFFGITSPDWQFAMDLHDELEREAREEEEEEERALRHLQERRTKALRDLESQTNN